MYNAKLKRTILGFIACVIMFCVCFTMQIFATTPSESTEETSSEVTLVPCGESDIIAP